MTNRAAGRAPCRSPTAIVRVARRPEVELRRPAQTAGAFGGLTWSRRCLHTQAGGRGRGRRRRTTGASTERSPATSTGHRACSHPQELGDLRRHLEAVLADLARRPARGRREPHGGHVPAEGADNRFHGVQTLEVIDEDQRHETRVHTGSGASDVAKNRRDVCELGIRNGLVGTRGPECAQNRSR